MFKYLQLTGHQVPRLMRGDFARCFGALSLVLVLLCGALPSVSAQNATRHDPEPYGLGISAERLKQHLEVLTSTELEGRETGKPGCEKAANYIAGVFTQNGLPGIADNGTCLQRMLYSSESWSKIAASARGKEYTHGKDFYALPASNNPVDKIEASQVLFLGYGIDDAAYSDYKGQKVKDKILLIYTGEPEDAAGKSLLTGSDSLSGWSSDWQKKIRTASVRGAKAVILIDPQFSEQLSKARKKFSSVTLGPVAAIGDLINHCIVSPEMAQEIAGKQWSKMADAMSRIRNTGKNVPAIRIKCPVELTMQKHIYSISSDNVLGYIEGSDPLVKQEVVIISAHYDHLGKKGENIYFGADDNGSGTAGVLEMAAAFAKARKEGRGPRRSILCLLMTGEEKGLWGSKYYTMFPVFPLSNTVADVNIDMIGRVDDKNVSDPDYIYVIGSDRMSTALHDINEQANARYTKLRLDYTYNAKDDPNRYYYRSDHYSFAQKGIPAIFYFNGVHPDYHKPTDTIEKINFDAMLKRTRLAFYTAWELADRPERIQIDVVEE